MVGAERELAGMGNRFLALVHAWAAPSLVVCVERDTTLEAGWRVVPELTTGTPSAGVERFLARLVQEARPWALTRPTLMRPFEDAPAANLKVKDSWLVPWSRGEAAGFLILRGVPDPYPPNLTDAVILVSQPIWPVLAARPRAEAPGMRLEDLAAEVRRLGERLSAAPFGAAAQAPAPVADEAATAALEQARRQVAALEERLALRDGAVAEAEAARDRLAAEVASLKESRTAYETQVAELKARPAISPQELEMARGQAESLRDTLAIIESARDRALAEVAELRAKADALEVQLATERAQPAAPEGDAAARERVASLEDKLASLEVARAEIESARDHAVIEVGALRERVQRLESELAEDRTPAVSGEALEAATQEVATLREAQKAAEAARDKAQAEAEELRGRLSATESSQAAGRSRSDDERQALEAGLHNAKESLREAEARLAQRGTELDELKRQLSMANGRAGALEREKTELAADRERIKAEVVRLSEQMESLQKQLLAEKDRLDKDRAQLTTLRASAERERDEARFVVNAAKEKNKQHEATIAALTEKWDKTLESLREALQVVRRTPFVPPTLRVAFGDLEGYAKPPEVESQPRLVSPPAPRVLFLDRDTTGIDRLAGELEAAGVEVLVAHYPEEVSFFLKTPEARRLSVVICDVMAFRPDQDLMDLFRQWRQEIPSLALLLSFKADNPSEAERAQRVPVVLTAGYLPRPLERPALLEAITNIRKRQAGRPGDAPTATADRRR